MPRSALLLLALIACAAGEWLGRGSREARGGEVQGVCLLLFLTLQFLAALHTPLTSLVAGLALDIDKAH